MTITNIPILNICCAHYCFNINAISKIEAMNLLGSAGFTDNNGTLKTITKIIIKIQNKIKLIKKNIITYKNGKINYNVCWYWNWNTEI